MSDYLNRYRTTVSAGTQEEILVWYARTIEPMVDAGGALGKLEEELGELRQAIDDLAGFFDLTRGTFDADLYAELVAARDEEAADVFVSFLAWCYVAKVPLRTAVQHKLAILRTRTWGEPDEQGVVRHNASGGPPGDD